MKMKEFGPPGEGARVPGAPLDPPMDFVKLFTPSECDQYRSIHIGIAQNGYRTHSCSTLHTHKCITVAPYEQSH